MIGSLNKVQTFLKQNDNFSLICHTNPDGDTIGSAFGLYYTLLRLNKNVNIILSDPWPQKYDYLYSFPFKKFKATHYISIDVASKSLLGKHKNLEIDLVIDHHPNNTINSNLKYIDNTASCAGELIYNISNSLLCGIDKRISDSIFTAITSDTGCFRYSNTTKTTHKIASELIERGADSSYINNRLFEQKSLNRIHLEKMVYKNLKILFDGRCSFVYISQKMMNKSGANSETFEGIPALIKSIEHVDLAITLRQVEKDYFKCSVRTTSRVNASDFCARFGGGGHIRAAGFKIHGNKKQIIDKILNSAKRMVY